MPCSLQKSKNCYIFIFQFLFSYSTSWTYLCRTCQNKVKYFLYKDALLRSNRNQAVCLPNPGVYAPRPILAPAPKQGWLLYTTKGTASRQPYSLKNRFSNASWPVEAVLYCLKHWGLCKKKQFFCEKVLKLSDETAHKNRQIELRANNPSKTVPLS